MEFVHHKALVHFAVTVIDHVHVEQAVALEKTHHTAHVTVVWSRVIVQALPQVQIVDGVKVHVVGTVNVLPQGGEYKWLNMLCVRMRNTSIDWGFRNLACVMDGSIANARVSQPLPSYLKVERHSVFKNQIVDCC